MTLTNIFVLGDLRDVSPTMHCVTHCALHDGLAVASDLYNARPDMAFHRATRLDRVTRFLLACERKDYDKLKPGLDKFNAIHCPGFEPVMEIKDLQKQLDKGGYVDMRRCVQRMLS